MTDLLTLLRVTEWDGVCSVIGLVVGGWLIAQIYWEWAGRFREEQPR